MTRKALHAASGYSLVEVLAAIVILTVAILPMVGMFDAALRATAVSGEYDAARSCANAALERARASPYEAVRAGLPDGACQTPGFAYSLDETFVDDSLRGVGEDGGLIRLTVVVRWEGGNSYEADGVISRW